MTTIPRARRVSSMAVLLATTTVFAGGSGWAAGRSGGQPILDAPAAAVDAHAGHHPSAGNSAPPSAAAAPDAHHGHHAQHAAEAGRSDAGGGRKHHGHDCGNGVCRCDSRCPSRRARPCGNSLSSCSGPPDEAGANPGPGRPFLLPVAVPLEVALEWRHRPDVEFLPATRDLEPWSPPPRTSSL